MRAVLNDKLYDTEKAKLIWKIRLSNGLDFNVYKSEMGNIFAENELEQNIISELTLKGFLQKPGDIEVYFEIFGQPEEA